MKKYINKINNIDCLEGLKKIKDQFVDLIITSPPYNLGNTHHTGTKRHKTYDDDMNEQDYQSWQASILDECFRVLKDNGSMIYNHKNRIKKGIQITPYEWINKSKFLVKQEIVWINRSQNFDPIRLYPFTERVYWLAKSPKTQLKNSIKHHDVFNWKEWPTKGTKGEFKRAFPDELVRDFLSLFPQTKLVLDPFMGSGTTALVCKQNKIDFIGFEINPDYVDLANKNLKNLKYQMKLL